MNRFTQVYLATTVAIITTGYLLSLASRGTFGGGARELSARVTEGYGAP